VTAVLVLRSLIIELARRGKAILYSSHIMESVERVCSRVMVLHRGVVVADDSSANLRTLMSRDSLEAVFAELVVQDNPARTASDIADVAAMRA
jgi:ABC-2 type transport system ATP-binding protein